MKFRMRSIATLGLALALLLGLAPGCGSASQNPVAPSAGTVSTSGIATNSVNHAIGGAVVATSFSQTMDAATITRTTFAVVGPDGTSVSGSGRRTGWTSRRDRSNTRLDRMGRRPLASPRSQHAANHTRT